MRVNPSVLLGLTMAIIWVVGLYFVWDLQERPYSHLHAYGCQGQPANSTWHADQEDEFPGPCEEIVRVDHIG